MLKWVGALFGALFIAAFAFISTRPDTYRIERSATVDAPCELVFGLVNDFENWPEWSPWQDLDPEQSQTYSGAEAGAGAITEWSGNEDVGKGRMEITESVDNERIGIDLAFIEPFESKARTRFDFVPNGTTTRVSWTMEGRSDIVMKAMSLVMDMDATVGADFEKGLARLDRLAQAEAKRRQEAAQAAAVASAEAAQEAEKAQEEAETGSDAPEASVETP
ncbi:MAG: SRPBCC family protein [Myxococcota bacterium]